MSRVGRPSKPTKIKELLGNPGNRPLNTKEPEFSEKKDHVPPPEFLDDGAKEEWLRMMPELVANGLLTSGDMMAFTAYCVSCARWVELEKMIVALKAKDPIMKGYIVKGSKTSAMLNPLVRAARDEMENMMRFGARFGFSPSDRAGITAKPKEDENPYAALERPARPTAH